MAKPTNTPPARRAGQPAAAMPEKPNTKSSDIVHENAIEKSSLGQRKGEADLDATLIYLGNAVLKARKEMGLTQLELSKKAKCASSAIFMIETARQNMTIRSLILVAAALNVQVGDLLPRTEQRMPKKLKELTELLIDSSSRIAAHLRTVDRTIEELSKEP